MLVEYQIKFTNQSVTRLHVEHDCDYAELLSCRIYRLPIRQTANMLIQIHLDMEFLLICNLAATSLEQVLIKFIRG